MDGVRKTATALLAVGLAFAWFAVMVFGVDVLIDAVGFLVAFNGLRPLARLWPKFRGGPLCALLLVAVSACALFVPRQFGAPLQGTRCLLEAALAVVLARGFGQMYRGGPKAMGRALAAAFYALAALGLAGGAMLLAGLNTAVPDLAVFVLHMATICLLFLSCILKASLIY